MPSFADLGLSPALTRAVADEGYTDPTPIQVQAIPHVVAGKDLLGLAQTGTGKTAAFALPILHRLEQSGVRPHGARPIRVLVLTPTRELAAQIGDSFAAYGRHLGFRHTVIFGGVGQSAQERELARGLDIVVATPGRLLDLAQQKLLNLSHLTIFVLDEADRMLDMGFIHDVRKVIALLPRERQTLFFSATMPDEAQRLADAILKNPVTVAVTPPSTTVERIVQSVYFVEKADKRNMLINLLRQPGFDRVLVFTRTKHGANRVSEALDKAGIDSAAIHGNKSQNARERALAGFKDGNLRVLVATDIAARGIDVDDVSHVINFELPNVPETYVHRIGRTARAGKEGIAVSLCEQEERPFLRDIERLTRQKIPVADAGNFRSPLPVPADAPPRRQPEPAQQQQQQQRPRGPMRPTPPPRAHHPQRQPAPGSRPVHARPQPPQHPQQPGTAHLAATHWDEDGTPVAPGEQASEGGGGAPGRRRRRRRSGRGRGPRPPAHQ